MNQSINESILLESPDILAVDKPEGLAAIVERDPSVACLHRMLEAEYDQKLYVVHRLDKDVSGVMLFARHAEAHRYLNGRFSNRQVQKTYLAGAHGVIEEAEGVIDAPIRPYGSGRMGVDTGRGKESRTTFRVTERLAAHTLVAASPITGRRHQLRVHFYHIGHPLVGDRRYGDPNVQRRYPRLLLHAYRLVLRLPSGEDVQIEAEPPESFNEVIDGLPAIESEQ